MHGIKGLVKLKVFGNDPEALLDYAPLCDAGQKQSYVINELIPHSNIWLAELDGVTDRTQAEKLRGVKLYVTRAQLPEIKDDHTYYHADLIGLAAEYPDGKPMGKIISIANFGAGDLLEVKPVKGSSFYVPFTKTVVPNIDLAAKKATIDPPPGLLD